MNVRFIAAFLVLVGSCVGQAPAGLSAKVKAELEGKYRFAPPPPVEAADKGTVPGEEAVLRLEPFTVTAFNSFRHDVGEAARRAAEAREAIRFSPFKGGLIWSDQIGPVDLKLGIWPMLIPYAGDALNKPGMRLSVDVIKINW
jgi:hypothetical protein